MKKKKEKVPQVFSQDVTERKIRRELCYIRQRLKLSRTEKTTKRLTNKINNLTDTLYQHYFRKGYEGYIIQP